MGEALFSTEVERAIRVAFEAHAGQTRKGDSIPYVSHPVHVALLLARVGADDTTLQAALLHDVVEDCEGWDLEKIGGRFGRDVQDVVGHLTETKGLAWEERKEAAVAHVAQLDLRAAMVKAADKTHNLRSLALKLDGSCDAAEVWRPFSRGPEETLAMALRLVEALESRLLALGAPGALAMDLRAAYEDLAGRCGGAPAQEL